MKKNYRDKEVNHHEVCELLNSIRVKNINNIIVAYLNINTFKNKYDFLKTLISDNIDAVIIGETKLDDSFPISQFKVEGFAEPFRLDRDKNGGGILIYVRDFIPCERLRKHAFPHDIEGIFLELNFRKSKWLLFATYHPPCQNIEYYLQNIGSALDKYIKTYDKCLLVGDFNAEVSETKMENFLEAYGLNSLIHEKTCCKSLINPSCIDLLLTNSRNSFKHSTVISTGLSDFHEMILTVLKTTVVKAKPKQIIYRDYKKFDNQVFKDDLTRNLRVDDRNKTNFLKFQITFLDVLEKHAPVKKRNVRANEVPYMTKTLRKAIMTRSRLQNRYHKLKTDGCLQSFKRQRNLCNRLYKRERKKFYSNLNLNIITDNKRFWKNIKPFFSNKGISKTEITLIEGDKIISNDLEVANTLNSFFEHAVTLLGIPQVNDYLIDNNYILDPIAAIIRKYSNHPSVPNINIGIKKSTFNFKLCNLEDIHNEILNLKSNVSCPKGSLSSNLLKDNIVICSEFLLNIINFGISNSAVDEGMKLADITPIFKKDESFCKENYRPISCLPAGSKVFERILHKQISSYIELYLSPYLCGYRKGYCAQYAIITLLEKWKTALDRKGYGDAILMDLSKAFDTLNHELMIAKLNAYGFSHDSLLLLHSYLSNR